jgi:hypothetical protein
MYMNELNFEKKNKLNQRELTPKKKTVTRKVTQLQLAVIFLFEVEILSSNHR